MRQMLASAIIGAVFAAACSSSSPSSPTPSIPQVAGTYTGQVTITLPEVGQSRTCPANTSVTQSGSNVNIAPIIFTGSCGNLSVPMGPTTIDATGALAGSGLDGVFTEPSCGGTYHYVGSGGFFGRELRLTLSATSGLCYNFNFTAVLTR